MQTIQEPRVIKNVALVNYLVSKAIREKEKRTEENNTEECSQFLVLKLHYVEHTLTPSWVF